MEELLKQMQLIAEVIKNDKDYKDTYYTTVNITMDDSHITNTETILIHGEIDNPYKIAIFKVISKGYLCDDMDDDFDYGFHDPFEPTKEVVYIIKNLDRHILDTITQLL